MPNMESPVKRKRDDEGSTGGGHEPSPKRQCIEATEVTIEDDIYILEYSSELRESRCDDPNEDNLKMKLDQCKVALNQITGNEEETQTVLEYAQFRILPAKRRIELQDKLNVAFSQANFAEVARFFTDLFPHASNVDRAGFKPCSIHSMRVPDSIFLEILRHMDSKFSQFGMPWEHQNETMRNYCLFEIFSPILDIFDGVFMDKAKVLMDSEVTKKRGCVKHRWIAFGSICAEYQELKFLGVDSGEQRLKMVAQMMLEADACATQNENHGFCIPVIGMFMDFNSMRALIYHPHTKTFFLSHHVPALPMDKTNMETLIIHIRQLADHIFGLLVPAYINSLDAFLARSERLTKKENNQRESTVHWRQASMLAKEALKLGREAASTFHHGVTTHYNEGELTECIRSAREVSEKAVQLLRESIAKSPKRLVNESLRKRYMDHENSFIEAEVLGLDPSRLVF
ncbi:hypothetical protein M422DRAFT_50786 [Sphaerobolus stellatus SS14]|uniref:Unplaced genomic scaffold SPHSTscaffold_98, whole genome shotgun sequence n=1 Tax=Sphaerobolus stellatus (strain SS14) TaxID=990650 RepID=A0A0C9U2G0_SPHS4|nr:hypothetical protein M422DRAFT_50786 [Sphaerobolus stellatus SS14]